MIKPHLWPRIEFFSPGGQESWCIRVIQQQPFTMTTQSTPSLWPEKPGFVDPCTLPSGFCLAFSDSSQSPSGENLNKRGFKSWPHISSNPHPGRHPHSHSPTSLSSTFEFGFWPLHYTHFCFCVFWSHCVANGILIPWLGIKPIPPALEAQNLNHLTAREVPLFLF